MKESIVHVVSISVCLKLNGGPSTEYPLQLLFSVETLHRSIHFGSVSLCVYVETVILERVSPGSAGSARWTESSSGAPPKTHPSLPIHYKEDRKKTNILSINDTFREILHCPSNAKQLQRFHVQDTCVNPLL